jgi:hypothetical protein
MKVGGMVKMSTIEFISNQNLSLSPAAKNYEMETYHPKFCYFRHFKVDMKDGII